MYRILEWGIRRTISDELVGSLLFNEGTHVVEYFTLEELGLLAMFICFIDSSRPDVYLPQYDGGGEWTLQDILLRRKYSSMGREGVTRLQRKGFIIGDDIMSNFVNPSIVLRYRVNAIVDTDGYLWYLDPCDETQVVLGDFCTAVALSAIHFYDNSEVVFVIDDRVESINMSCFSDPLGMFKPKIKCSLKHCENMGVQDDFIFVGRA